MNLSPTLITGEILPCNVGNGLAFTADMAGAYQELEAIGISFKPEKLLALAAELMPKYQARAASSKGRFGMDADLTAGVLPATIGTPIQFLQYWLPGFINVITQARTLDYLIGVVNGGNWADDQVVFKTLEGSGAAIEYGDSSNISLANWNHQIESRTIVRFEKGFEQNVLESEQAAAMELSSIDAKRSATINSLEISRNIVGYNGYNNGNNRTYGFLNDPNLPAYTAVPSGIWSGLTYNEIVADLQNFIVTLRTQSFGNIDPKRTPTTLALSQAVVDYLTTPSSQYGATPMQWLNQNYPLITIESAVELNGANGGANVAYYYAPSVMDDGSTDGGRTFMQVVPVRSRLVGVQQLVKGMLEDYSNATAGTIVTRPWAITRWTGL